MGVVGGILHGIDGKKDVFPCLRGFLDINMWQRTGSIRGWLWNSEHVFEDWGYERQDGFMNAEVHGPCCADDNICVIGTENCR